MSEGERAHVACAVVGSYLPHAAAMLASLAVNGGEPDLTVHLLHDGGLPGEDLDHLAEMLDRLGVDLEQLEIDDARIEGLPTAGFTGKGSWYRIFLPDLLPTVDRVLYLDVDLLVLEPITPLRAVDLSGAYVAAVTNVFETVHLHRPAELGLAGPERYFNAGVLLMNLEAMRRDRCGDELFRFGVEHAAELVWRDQDALNVVLGESRVSLPPRWNCMNSVAVLPQAEAVFDRHELDEARRRPAIRHFEGPSLNKPWHVLADSADRRTYSRFRRMTPWPRVELEDRTPATMLLRALPARRRASAYVRLLRWRARRSRPGSPRVRDR